MAALTGVLNQHPTRCRWRAFRWSSSGGRLGVTVRRFGILGYLGGLGILGCGEDNPAALLPHTASRGYWALALNQHVLNLATVAPYNTAQLTAIPLDQNGVPLPDLGRASFQLPDSSVTIDTLTGVVTAHFSTLGQSAAITVALTSQGVTHQDTVLVQVTDTVPQQPLQRISLQPVAPDSAKRALNFNTNFGFVQGGTGIFSWPAQVMVNGITVCSATLGGTCPLLIYYHSSDPSIAEIDRATGQLLPHTVGHVTLTATTYAYGIMKQDSVVFRIGYLLNQCYALPGTLSLHNICEQPPAAIVMGIGTVVTFANSAYAGSDALGNIIVNKQADGVTFTDTSGVDSATAYFQGCCSLDLFGFGPTGSGNILPFRGDTNPADGQFMMEVSGFRARRLRTAGIYRWTSTLVPSDTFTIEIRNDQ